MRKSILLTVCLVAIVSVLISAPVDSLTCMRVASNFYRERAGAQYTRGASPVLVKTYKTLPNDARDSVNCLHIYNVGDGYVIVSADDRITPVLGYSTEGNFDAQRMPVQLQEWLSQYAAAIGAAVSSPTFTNEAVASSWRALASENYTPTRPGTIIVPPLISTHWDQYPYYNNYCPYDASAGERVVTGCVATAMAQLIRFWTFPSQGIGSHSYTHPTYGVQSANFGATTYNYSLMPLQLSSSSSTAEINEVARLMYHCGVSVDMYYDLLANGGSGASTQVAASSFITYFGYSGCQYQSKSDFTELQWKNKLKTELNHGRPVLYSGSGSGGHAFICDGYTADNYFHFNFGWSGAHDGYFLLDNITPGAYNFSYTQGGIFNLSASSPILRASEEEIDFLIESGTISEGRKVNIITHNLSNPVSITTSSPFFVSTDSVHYSTSVSLSTGGGAFYIRYQPATGIHSDSANVAITSGSLTENISLKGFTYTINCLPVNDLNISSSDLSHINIAWTEPQMDTTPQILTWNNAKTSNYSYNNNKVTLLQRFTTADLASHHNQTLTGISFYVTSGFSVLKLVVYKGSDFRGTSFNPGTLIVEETIPVSTLTGNSWNTFTLSHPVTIDAHEELCFGVYMESSYAYPIPVGSPIVAKKGSIIGYSNGSGGQSWSQINSYSVCLRGIIQNTQSVTHYEVSRDGTPLGSTTSTSYNDIVSHTDTYHYTVTALWDNGCSADTSQDFTNIASITANPQILEFHNNYGLSNMVKSVQIGGNGLTQPIQISVSGNFKISTNGTSYSTSATLPTSGGVLYVKYTPTSSSTTFESGQINLTSGTLSTHVSLSGQCHGDCNPPENLVLSTSGSTVALDWNAPTYSPDPPQTLSWCTSFGGYYSYGSNNIRLSMVQRFESSDLVLHHNKKLTSISFAIPTDTTVASCKIVVYKGGSYSGGAFNPGTLIYEQNVSLSALSSWNWITVPLNTPVTIDATQELWFGVDISFSGKSFYLCYNSTSSVPKKGGITNYNNYGWYEESISFALKALVEDVPLTLTRYQIDRNNSTIVPNTSATSYTDNVGSNGNYDYTVWAVWSNGCRAGTSGSVSISGGCTTPGSVTTRNQCGGTYTWHGTTYNASGTYTYAFTNGSGCQQVDTLRLNIHSNPTVSINGNSSICSGASTTLTASGANTYSWNTGASGASISVHPTSNTTYTVTGTNSYGCSATATFTVNVTSPTLATVSTSTVSSITTSTATCGGTVSSDACSPVTARGVCWSTSSNPTVADSHTTNGTGTGTFTSSLTGLSVNTTYYVRAYATTAAGTAYGEEKSFTTGCSAITVTISGNSSICSGASTTLTASGASTYSWNTGASGASISVHPTSTTAYTVTGTNSYGCSATATFSVNVASPTLATVNTSTVSSVTTSTATCGGSVSSDACSPVTARGVCWSTSHNPTVSGSHTTNGTGTGTFTSSLTGLSVNTTYYVRAYATTAAGTSYGEEKSFKTGCSAITVTISGNSSICSGASTTLTASGASTYSWSTGASGASISVHPTSTTAYTVTGTNSYGCSATATFSVNVASPTLATVNTSTVSSVTTSTATCGGSVSSDACSPVTARGVCWSTSHNPTVSGSHTTNGTGTGTFTSNLTGLAVNTTYYVRAYATTAAGTSYGEEKGFTTGCTPAQGIETLTACGSFTWHGITYTESTSTPTYTIPNGAANGCDSIVTLHLTIKPIPVVTISGNTYIHRYESTTLTASGASNYTWSTGVHYSSITVSPLVTTTYTVTGTTGGCVSAPASVTVTVGDCIPFYEVETVTACDSFTWHGVTYTESTNTPTHTFPNGASNGCDSIVNLHLTVFHATGSSLYINHCGSYTWGETTYTTSGVYTQESPGPMGCIQVDTLHLTIIPIPVVTISGDTDILLNEGTIITASGAESYVWSNGVNYAGFIAFPTTTTTYTVTGYNSWCASDPVSITVHVRDCTPAQSIETVTACDSYTWHGHTYTASTSTATYTIPGGAASGCDSIVTLHLTIHKPAHSAVTVSECGSYTWTSGNGQTYTQSGIYLHSHTDSHGCTQVDTLHLTIKPIPVVTITGNTSIHLYESTTLTAHGASSYTWSNGSHASAITVTPASATTYSVSGTTDGCASAPASVTVSVGPCLPPQGVETVTACGSYTWHGHTYNSSTNTPTYTIPGGAATGCDSIVTLHLTIRPIPVVTIAGNTSILIDESTTLTASGASSYTWSNGSHASAITVSPTSTTTYTVVGTMGGCASAPVSVTVNVSACRPGQRVETITACNSYTWTSGNGQTYTESTNATYTIPNGAVNGCDSIVTLHLIVRHPANEYSVVTGCGSYTWNGTIYTQSGTYTFNHTDSYGCTLMDTLVLTIKPKPVVTVTGNTSILASQSTTLTAQGATSYLWSNGSQANAITVSPTDTTLYTVVGTTDGCSSEPVRVTVNVSPCTPVQGVETVTACDSYTWHGTTYTESTDTATYTIPGGAANGCDSIVTLHLTVRHPANEYSEVTECGSFTWNGTIYTQSGIYTHSHTDSYGCTQMDTLILTINPIPVVTVTGNSSINLNESTTLTVHGSANMYVWSTGSRSSSITVSPTTTTTYSVVGIANGCTSEPVNFTVNVIVCSPVQSVETVTACDSYTWHGRTFYESTDTATYTVPNGTADGCDSTVTLHLTIHHPTHTAVTISECGSYTWTAGNGQTYTTSGTYTYTHQDAHGCMQVDTLHLTIKPVPVVTISGNTSIHLYESTTLTAHGASSYSWSNGSHANAITVTPSTTTTYSVTGTTDGCASAPASITVNVGSCIPGQGVETVTACGSYTWHGHTYTASTNTATHTISGGASTGCDSIVTLHLTIKPVPVVTISGNTSIHLYESTTLTAHGASSYSWSTGASTGAITVTPSATTTYSVIGTTDGCASAPASVTVNVGSCIPGQGVETVTACGSYTWHGTTYTASTNTATHTIPGGAATGCDSIVTLHLTINHIVASADSVTACDSYTWTDGDGQTYTESGTYTYSHPDANGCTQVDTLFLTIYPTPPAYIIGTTSIHLYESTTLIALGGATYVWSTGETGFSITVAPSVTTTYTVTSYANGCASNPVSVTVEVGPCIPAQGVEEITACGSYTWHGTTYTASTSTATHTIPGGAATGCDSIVTLHLTIKPVPVVTISGNTSIHLYESTTLTAHGASSYSWSTGASTGAITVTPSATTTYSVTGTTDGCASAPASVTVNVGPCIPGQGVETVTACGSYTWHGTTYTANTSTATHTIPGGAASGCDSIVTLHLTLYHPTHTAATVTECNSYTWHGTTYTTSGEYYYVHDDNHGCTQVDTLHLTILHPQHSSTAVNSCGSYTWNGSTYSISGVYTYSHTDANGCTQVDTLHLTVRPKPVVTISGDTYIHLYESSTLTANGADSYVWSTGEQANPITVSPTSATTYSVTGSSNGCTSEPAHITIVVGPCIPAQGVETFTACESFTWHGTTYTESTNTATFTISGGAATGCDSVVTLHLTIHHAQHISTTVSECGSYTWASGNGQTYTQSGTYLHSHTDANSCTQVDTLHLTIRPIPVVTISGNASIHLYESTILSANGANSYSWSTGASSSAITVSPATTTTYSVTGTTDGCASAPASMTVTVGPCIPAQGVETVTACGSYTWHGTTYTASTSTATHTVPNGAATGCDSIVTLHLTINNPAHTAITVSECDSYTWSAGNGQTYTASGHYLYSHPDANGCTQVDTLHLTIRPIPVVTISGNTSIHLYESTTLTANGASSYSWSTGANTGAITVSPATTTTYSVTGTTDGCTSTPASVTVTVGPCIPAQGVETVTACGNYTWHGTTYYESTDTATHTVPNGAVTGCDSIVTLHLTIYNPVHTAITVDTCDSYVWNGIPYTTSGTHTFSHYGEGGCLQVDTLHLTIHHTQYSEFTVAIPDSCYTWNGTEYCENGDFSQTMTDQFGCDSTVTLHLTLRVGVTQYDEQYDLTIYPNPTSSILYIESGAQISQFHLYNAFGQKIKSRTVNGTNGSLDLSDLATGTYYIRVETDKGVVVKKVIRNK